MKAKKALRAVIKERDAWRLATERLAEEVLRTKRKRVTTENMQQMMLEQYATAISAVNVVDRWADERRSGA